MIYKIFEPKNSSLMGSFSKYPYVSYLLPMFTFVCSTYLWFKLYNKSVSQFVTACFSINTCSVFQCNSIRFIYCLSRYNFEVFLKLLVGMVYFTICIFFFYIISSQILCLFERHGNKNKIRNTSSFYRYSETLRTYAPCTRSEKKILTYSINKERKLRFTNHFM